MKANRKFLHGDEEAVSPVIAVILMVAITVVLAATVYVWVSGFGSNSNSSPAHTLSLVSAGAITSRDTAADGIDFWYKYYTVASADPSLTYGDIKVTLAGAAATIDATAASCAGAANSLDASTGTAWLACGGTTERATTDAVSAGDKFIVICHSATDCLSNKDMLLLDNEANSVMVTLKVR